MNTSRHISFSIITSFVLCSILLSLSLFSSSSSLEQSYLEGRNYQPFPAIGLNELDNKTFQNDIELFLSDHTPFRNDILLANSRMQKALIEISNTAFQFDIYPTFYNSSYLYSPSEKRLFETPFLKTDYYSELSKANNAYSQLFNSNPDISWRIALVDRSGTFNNSPASDLVECHANYNFFKDELRDIIASKYEFIDLSDINTNDDAYFKSDHHWQIQSGITAYKRIIESLDRTPIEFGNVFEAFSGPFYGALARNGRETSIYDIVFDVQYYHQEYNVFVNGEKEGMGYLCKAFDENQFASSDTFANVYADYFHGDPNIIEIENPSANAGSLLIVGDSFTNNIDRFFAENYQKVTIVDPRDYDGYISSLINENDYDACVFIMSASNITSDRVVEKLVG